MTSTFAGRINLSLYFIFNANIVRAPDLLTTNVSILPQRQCYSNGPTRKRSTLWNRFIILVLCKSFLSQFWNKTVIQKMYSIMELPVILRVQVINPASQQMQCFAFRDPTSLQGTRCDGGLSKSKYDVRSLTVTGPQILGKHRLGTKRHSDCIT